MEEFENKDKNKETEGTEEVESKKVNMSSFSRYFCTVYKSIYIVSVIIPFLIFSVGISNNNSSKFTTWYIITLILLVVMLVTAYYISRKIKLKKNKLLVTELSVGKKIKQIVLTILLIGLTSVASAFINILIYWTSNT
jgi:hypothetical protein